MRTDITQWTLHFVRSRDVVNDFPREDDYLRGPLNIDAEAPEVLATIIQEGALRPGYSFRSGRTTIYGGKPAVCFTEMPLYALAKYVKSRSNEMRVSPYGVAVLKNELFSADGRPVIYGLSEPAYLKINTPYVRILEDSCLPLREQYRYVAYDPSTATRRLDWTHEREWRWIARGDDAIEEESMKSICDPRIERHRVWLRDAENVLDQRPALPLFRPQRNGGYFSQIGMVVPTMEDAERMLEQLGRLYDAGHNNDDEPFCRDILKYSFVVVLENLVEAVEKNRDVRCSKIETLPHSSRIYLTKPTVDDAKIAEAKRAVAGAQVQSKMAVQKLLGHSPQASSGGCGGAWVITETPNTQVTEALIAAGLARPMGGEYYIVDANDSNSMVQAVEEAGATAAAEYLTKTLQQNFYVHVWWD